MKGDFEDEVFMGRLERLGRGWGVEGFVRV